MARRYEVEGNTVRQYEIPRRYEQPSREELLREERRRRKREQLERRSRSAAESRSKAMVMSSAYMIFLLGSILAVAVSCYLMISARTAVTNAMNQVTTMESRITDLRAENDARYKEVTTSVDLDSVKDIAINEYGMTYADEDQIVYYSIEKSNYMDQYSNIPQ